MQTHVTLDSAEDEGFHDEFGLRNAISLERALLLIGFLQCDIKNWAIGEMFLRPPSLNFGSYHRKHFRKLRSGAREHRGHDEIQEGHQFQEVVLQRSPCQQQAILSLRGGRERGGSE